MFRHLSKRLSWWPAAGKVWLCAPEQQQSLGAGGCVLGLLVSPPALPCCDPNNHCRLSRARPMLRLVYHLKAAQLSSICHYLFASDYIFNGFLVPAAVLLVRSPVLSNALAVPVAGDSHWDYWVSRQCGLLDSVPVATVRTGTKTGQAWLVLPSQCWG